MFSATWTRPLSTIIRPIRCSFSSTACRAGPRLASRGPNYGIIRMLMQDMLQEEDCSQKNVFKVRAFASAIAAIERLEHPICSSTEACDIKGIGSGIARRIGIFLGETQDSHPQRTQVVQDADRHDAITALRMIPGIGPVMAAKLVDAGCTTVAELQERRFYEGLPPAVRVALDFAECTSPTVDREQIETVAAFIRDHISLRFEIHIVDGHRRGASTSSGINVLLFHPSHIHMPTPTIRPDGRLTKLSIPFLSAYTSIVERDSSLLLLDVVQPLVDRGLIAGTLASGTRKWQGMARLPSRISNSEWEDKVDRSHAIKNRDGVFFRLDLNLAPLKSRGAAFIALTGDAHFIRMLRIRAFKRGMHLNEFGLWRWHPMDQTVASSTSLLKKDRPKGYWELIETKNEAELFLNLGMDYVAPEARTASYIPRKAKRAQ